MDLNEIILKLDNELNSIIIEDIILEMAVANFTDRAGQLTSIRNDAEARESGWDRLGRAVYTKDGDIKIGPMSTDHVQLLKSLGSPDGLRFFWGIKGATFLFTGKNDDDLESLYRMDRMKQANGNIVYNVISTIMQKIGAQQTQEFKKKIAKSLEDAGVYRPKK
jgi:hypothetical protein